MRLMFVRRAVNESEEGISSSTFHTRSIRELYLGLSHLEGVTLIRQQSLLFTTSTRRHEKCFNTSSAAETNTFIL